MHKRMIVVLPLLLASTVNMAEASEFSRDVPDRPKADTVTKSASVAALPDPSTVGKAAGRDTLLSGQSSVKRNISCSEFCETSDGLSAHASFSRRTKLVMTASVQPETGVGPLARRCGPSPLSATQIETLVERVATLQGVDPQLAKAVAWAESRYDRVRNSPKGARGPMQLMPATAWELGVTDICDPHANIDAGVRHLKQLLDQFGNPLLAVAAYNAGSRAVIDHDGIPPFGETRAYVARVVNRQFDLPAAARKTAVELTTARVSPQPEAQSHLLGTVSHRFIDGVLHLPSQGGLQ